MDKQQPLTEQAEKLAEQEQQVEQLADQVEELAEQAEPKIQQNSEIPLRKRIPYKKAPYKRWNLAGKTKHVTWKHKLVMYLTTISVLAYVVWRIFCTLPIGFGFLSVFFSILLLLAEMASFTITISNFREATHYINPECPDIPLDWYPDVDVYITTHNETVDLMFKTVSACTFMDYPDKSKVHIWLCDDNNRPEMQELAQSLNVGYVGMVGNKHAKAGNLNNAFWQTSSPLVVTFDADMIPSSDFLLQTVPYFYLPHMEKQEDGSWRILQADEIDEDYKIGFVQSPQSFYNPDLFQFNLYSEANIPNEQDYFFREVNVAKNTANASTYAGSNTVLARQALVDIDGFAAESITEDFLTGLMILEAGYRNLAIPEQLAHGLSPDTIKSLMSQRDRWTRGNIQVFRLLRIWMTRALDFWQKFSLTAALCYWFSFAGRLIFLLAPVLAALFNIRVVDAPLWQTLCFWLPHYILHQFAQRIFSDYTRSNHWSAIVDTIMAPYLTMPALMELIGISEKKFVVTDKSKGEAPPAWRTSLYVLPHMFLLILTAIAIFIIVRHSIIINTIYSPLVLFWLIIGAKNLLFAIFFMLGRTNMRNAERFKITADVCLECNGVQFNGQSLDASDGGLSAVFDTPINCLPETEVDLQVQTERYSAFMKCQIFNVNKLKGDDENKWKYGFKIVSIEPADKQQYVQILYDRPHSLPMRFKPNASVFDDINTNLMRRTKNKEANLRSLPRLYVELPFVTAEGVSGVLNDFNFKHARMSLSKNLPNTDLINLFWDDGLDIVLMAEPSASGKSDLYRVVNSEEILTRSDFVEIMNRWTELQDLPAGTKPSGSGYLSKIIDYATSEDVIA